MGSYLQVTKQTTLSQLADAVGERNVDYVLNANGLTRSVNIGKKLLERDTSGSTDAQTKLNILNTLVGSSDVYEKAALGTEEDWVSLSKYNTFKDYIYIPEEVRIPLSTLVLGNREPVTGMIYEAVSEALKNPPYAIDPAIFSEYSSIAASAYGAVSSTATYTNTNPFEWFKLPWGKISLYSSLSKELIDFPVYPLELSDGVSANYEQMPNMLYQYEPWNVYQSSGPRTNTYTFKMHRDMWTGDHRDGLANKLIRYCEANCYPQYNGSAVHTSTVTLYINSVNHITGILTDYKVDWEGPLGLDGWYLELTLSLTITEVAKDPINYTSIKNRGLME